MTSWHELIPLAGEFINKVGFPVAMWVVAAYTLYRVSYKLFQKFEPFISDAIHSHFSLINELKENSKVSVGVMSELKDNTIQTLKMLEKVNGTLVEQNDILTGHSEKLDKFKDMQCLLNVEKTVEEAPVIMRVNDKRKV